MYMPIRRNLYQKKFGFIHFQEEYQAEEALKRLDGAWLLDYRIMVKHARRKVFEQRWREVKHYELQKQDKTYVGTEEIKCNNERDNKSYKQALIGVEVLTEQELRKNEGLFVGTGSTKQIAEVEAVVDEESLQCLENCVVGTANGWFDAEWLEENFRIQGAFDLKVKKLARNQFLIQFEEKEEVLRMEKE